MMLARPTNPFESFVCADDVQPSPENQLGPGTPNDPSWLQISTTPNKYNNFGGPESQFTVNGNSNFESIIIPEPVLQKHRSEAPRQAPSEVDWSWVVMKSTMPQIGNNINTNPFEDSPQEVQQSIYLTDSKLANNLLVSWVVAEPIWKQEIPNVTVRPFLRTEDLTNYMLELLKPKAPMCKQHQTLLGVVACKKMPTPLRWLHWVTALGGLPPLCEYLLTKEHIGSKNHRIERRKKLPHKDLLYALRKNLKDTDLENEYSSCIEILQMTDIAADAAQQSTQRNERLADLLCVVRFGIRESIDCMKQSSKQDKNLQQILDSFCRLVNPLNPERYSRATIEEYATIVVLKELLQQGIADSEAGDTTHEARGLTGFERQELGREGLQQQLVSDGFRHAYRRWVDRLWTVGVEWTADMMYALVDVLVTVGPRSVSLVCRLQMLAALGLSRGGRIGQEEGFKIADLLKPENRSLVWKGDRMNDFLWSVKEQVVQEYFQVNLK